MDLYRKYKIEHIQNDFWFFEFRKILLWISVTDTCSLSDKLFTDRNCLTKGNFSYYWRSFYLIIIINFCKDFKTSQLWWNLCLIVPLRDRHKISLTLPKWHNLGAPFIKAIWKRYVLVEICTSVQWNRAVICSNLITYLFCSEAKEAFCLNK